MCEVGFALHQCFLEHRDLLLCGFEFLGELVIVSLLTGQLDLEGRDLFGFVAGLTSEAGKLGYVVLQGLLELRERDC